MSCRPLSLQSLAFGPAVALSPSVYCSAAQPWLARWLTRLDLFNSPCSEGPLSRLLLFWLLLQQLSLIWPGSCRRLLTECRSIARRGYCIWAGVKIFNGRPVVLLSRLLLAMCRQQLLREIFQTRLLSCSCGLFKGGELVMTGKPYNRNREQHSPCASGSPNV